MSSIGGGSGASGVTARVLARSVCENFHGENAMFQRNFLSTPPLGRLAHALLLLAVIALTAGCNASVNKSIRIADGESVTGDLTSVNGSINVGNNAQVKGNAQTVNGRIRVGDSVQIGRLSTVNGGIDIGGQTQVGGDVESVNGSVECEAGSTIEGDIQTVNGRVLLEGTTVNGEIETRNGAVLLTDGTRVGRDVRIEGRTSGFSGGSLEIRLTGGSVIEGDLIVEDEDRKVRLTVDETSEVKGQIRGVEMTRPAAETAEAGA